MREERVRVREVTDEGGTMEIVVCKRCQWCDWVVYCVCERVSAQCREGQEPLCSLLQCTVYQGLSMGHGNWVETAVRASERARE